MARSAGAADTAPADGTIITTTAETATHAAETTTNTERKREKNDAWADMKQGRRRALPNRGIRRGTTPGTAASYNPEKLFAPSTCLSRSAL